MKLKIESSEFTIEELLHHIGKGRGSHLKAVIINKMEATESLAEFRGKSIISLAKLIAERDKRIAELEALTEHLNKAAHNEHAALVKAEAELARRDAVAGEPVGYEVITASGEVMTLCKTESGQSYLNMNCTLRPVFTSAQPSALPPEMENISDNPTADINPFIDGWNAAIQEAKALGCKAIKLPGFSELIELSDCIPSVKDVSLWDAAISKCAEMLREQGFTVEGE